MGGGTWELIPENYSLWTTEDKLDSENVTIAPGLPDSRGIYMYSMADYLYKFDKANIFQGIFKASDNMTRYGHAWKTGDGSDCYTINARVSNGQIYSETTYITDETTGETTETTTDHYTTEEGYTDYQIYGKSNTVQPPAVKVRAWKRTA